MKKKRSTSKTGQIYKLKTKKWFIERGYACEYAEKLQTIFTPRGRIYIKRDLFGADGLAMNGKEMIFWNSKFGRVHIAQGVREFLAFPYPPETKRWLVVWEKGEKEPEIVEVKP